MHYALCPMLISFLKNEVNRQHKKDKSNNMIPLESLSFEHNQCESCKDKQSDHLLNYFQFNQRKRSPMLMKANPVSRYLETIFEEGYAPV